MIIFIEGPRHVGKTHLINSFFAQNKNPDIIYYKFQFAKYIEELGFRDHEAGPGVHYFSIANVLTILELNRTLLKDKIMIFDRSIFSAYVWSIYRKRMPKARLLSEFSKILNGELYQECTVLYLTRNQETDPEKREKDYFGNFENYTIEKKLFEDIFKDFRSEIIDSKKSNHFMTFTNNFDTTSVSDFCEILNSLATR